MLVLSLPAQLLLRYTEMRTAQSTRATSGLASSRIGWIGWDCFYGENSGAD